MKLPDPFQCEVTYRSGAWIIALSGELDLATAPEVEATAMVVRAVEGSVTLDLRGLDFMDASGLGLILGLDAAARRYGFDLRVLTDGNPVQRVLIISGVHDRVSVIDGPRVLEEQRRDEYAVIATDIGGLVTLWNNEAERVYGWSALEALGRPIIDLTVGPEDREAAEEIIASVQRNGFWEGEFEVRTKAGSRLRSRVRTALITDLDGNFTGFAAVSTRSTDPALAATAARRRRD